MRKKTNDDKNMDHTTEEVKFPWDDDDYEQKTIPFKKPEKEEFFYIVPNLGNFPEDSDGNTFDFEIISLPKVDRSTIGNFGTTSFPCVELALLTALMRYGYFDELFKNSPEYQAIKENLGWGPEY